MLFLLLIAFFSHFPSTVILGCSGSKLSETHFLPGEKTNWTALCGCGCYLIPAHLFGDRKKRIGKIQMKTIRVHSIPLFYALATSNSDMKLRRITPIGPFLIIKTIDNQYKGCD